MSKILLGLCVVALVVLLVMRNKEPAAKAGKKKATLKKATPRQIKQKNPEQKQASTTRGATEDFRSVTIRTKLEACNAAIALKDQVFLAREAPSLPLAECDAMNCACRYRYLDDRRQEDRRTPYGLKHGAVVGGTDGNRRDSGDRRK
jgi:hypothetical protein